MRLQSVVLTNEAIQIAYVDEADMNPTAGIMRGQVIELAHEVVPQALIDDLIDSANQIIDQFRLLEHKVADEFRAPL